MRNLIDAFCLQQLGRKPNLDAPTGYNDKVQWLKLHDQMPEQVACCDKYAARDYVAAAVGPEYLLDCYQVADRFTDLTFRAPCVVKATHDSGTVAAIRSASDWSRAAPRFAERMARPYGVEKGEWAYARIKPRAMVERLMPDPIVDYKFHCVGGRVAWVQIISERASGSPLEAITDPDGARLSLHFDENMRHATAQPPIPATWQTMRDVAIALSRPFRYVRVDLYSSEGRVYFGELTFWPKAGCYRTKDEPRFGAMLNIDMSFKRPCCV